METWTIEVRGKTIYEAQPRQCLFHDSIADETLFGGQAGGGKSKAILADAIGNAISHKGLKIGIFRRTYPELVKSLISELRKTLPYGLYNYNKQEKTATIPNGSTLEFNYCANEDDVYRYQSVEYDLLYFDELTHFTEFQYTYLLSRLRTTRTDIRPQVKSSSNPGNIGHRWVKTRFIEGAIPEQVTVRRDRQSERDFSTIFIPSAVSDNKYIDPGYVNRLKALPEMERQMLLHGNWDIFAGQAFGELKRDLHIVNEFEVPQEWKLFGAYDHGFNHPFSFGIFAVDRDGTTYLVKRVKSRLKRVDEIAHTMEETAEEFGGLKRLSYIVAGWDCWNRQRDGGPTIAEQFLKSPQNVLLTRAKEDRKQAVNQVRRYIAWKGIAQDESGEPKDGKPMLYFFKNCEDVYETMVSMLFDENDPEDVKKVDANENGIGGDDHYDMIRYGLMSRPRPLPQREIKPEANSFEGYLRKKREARLLANEYVGYGP